MLEILLSRWKGDVHDGTSEEHIRRGVDAFYPSTRRVLFFIRGISVPKKVDKEAAIIFQRRIHGAGKTVGIDTISVRLVVLFVSGIVNHQSIQGWRTANDDPIHSVGHVFCSGVIPIFFVVKETE
jgi:hypothetical protein